MSHVCNSTTACVRGAYTVRKLAGLIVSHPNPLHYTVTTEGCGVQDKIGLLETEKLGIFFNIWKELIDGKPPTIPPGTRTTRIR